jgi:hypothetical protein
MSWSDVRIGNEKAIGDSTHEGSLIVGGYLEIFLDRLNSSICLSKGVVWRRYEVVVQLHQTLRVAAKIERFEKA